MKMILITTILMLLSLPAIANEAREKIYLIQIINQLEAIKSLAISANQEQEKEARIKFHYTSYHDSNGLFHNGLLEDINEIERGIQKKLNPMINEPRHFQEIKGDYLDLKNIKSNWPKNTREINDAK
ncbi:MAG: hypothetical protein K0S27_1707 [Gammaproteobacteria bacterium]|jgi:RAQPRD family integrative conjugative element protein|nr:hypothetical protein [Gammaproteobacteria bacterium]